MKCAECGCTLPVRGTAPGLGWNEDCETCTIAAMGAVPRTPDYDYIQQLDTLLREIIVRARLKPTLTEEEIANYVQLIDFVVNGP